MYTLLNISDFIIYGFVLTTIFLSLAFLFLRSQRQTLIKLIVLSNVYLLIASLIFLIVSVRLFLIQYEGNEEWEKYALTTRLLGPYWFAYVGAILFKGLFPQILWIKKVRHNIWASIALVPFLLVDFYYLIPYSNHRDYIPASSTIYHLNFSTLFLSIVVFGFLLSVTFIVTRKNVA